MPVASKAKTFGGKSAPKKQLKGFKGKSEQKQLKGYKGKSEQNEQKQLKGYKQQNEQKQLKGYKGKSQQNEADKKGYKNKSQQNEDFELVPPTENFDFEAPIQFQTTHEDDAKEIYSNIQAVNRKGAKTGGFQSMGLSPNIFKAIQHKGYKIPTPIQRKAIPIIFEGKDIVAMARTGSGKTAAFLIPLIERLKAHKAMVGVRGIILSPSRELALQTLKFAKEMSKYTDLRCCMLVGGESIEEQFNAIAGNPDIIIATPGRFMHLLVEMSLNLRTVEYIVFDEADRLFEMGFAEHLREILHKLPEQRQTLLFSATLPKTLVEFARAGLTDPALVRLDMDTKISKDLQLTFLSIKQEEKEAALLYVLRKFVLEDQMAMIFAPTRHHVDYLYELLKAAGITSTYIYGALDQSARKIHLARFRAGRVKLMIVTDVAARGIDIPLLDFVINYEFPAAPKVFVHRVGRVARAGRTGTAISFVTGDELPYLLDLQLFLGRSLVLGATYENRSDVVPDYTSEVVFGSLPPNLLGMDMEHVQSVVGTNATVSAMLDSSRNAYKLYLKTRVGASNESYTRAKEVTHSYVGIHPLIVENTSVGEIEKQDLLRSISSFRPAETVFEVGKRGSKAKEALLMQKRRSDLSSVISGSKSDQADKQADLIKKQATSILNRTNKNVQGNDIEIADEEEISSVFVESKKKRKRDDEDNDDEYYMSHYQKDEYTEKGYAMQNKPMTFAEQVKSATMDLNGDDQATMLRGKSKSKSNLIWDKVKHKFVRPTIGADNKKMIKTESGALISSSYKSDRFDEWQKKKRISIPRSGEQELSNAGNLMSGFGEKRYRYNTFTEPTPNSKNAVRKSMKRSKETQGSSSSAEPKANEMVSYKSGQKSKMVRHKTVSGRGAKSELKNQSQIIRERKEKDRRRAKTGRPSQKEKSGRQSSRPAQKKRKF